MPRRSGKAQSSSSMATPSPASEPSSLFPGRGEMAALMRDFDWSRSAVGDPAGWPQSLKTIVRVMLDSRFAMWMAWGPQYTFFCNDAYAPTVGIKRDWALGARADQVWAEIWPNIGPLIDQDYLSWCLLPKQLKGCERSTYSSTNDRDFLGWCIRCCHTLDVKPKTRARELTNSYPV